MYVCVRASARLSMCVCVRACVRVFYKRPAPLRWYNERREPSRGEQPVELAVGETCKEFLPFVATETCLTLERVHRACKDLVHVHCK